MTREFLEKLLENLDSTCFPHQFDLNNEKLYIKGLEVAINQTLKELDYVIIPKGEIHSE